MDGEKRFVNYSFDEANHGGFPEDEFFCMVSEYPGQAHTDRREHHFKHSSEAWREIKRSKTLDFRYTVIKESHYEYYGQAELIVQAVPLLIESFSHNFSCGKVGIDGRLDCFQKRDIVKRTKQLTSLTDLICEDFPKTKRDNKVRKRSKKTIYIVSLADGMARFLFQNRNLLLGEDFADKRIVLDIELSV